MVLSSRDSCWIYTVVTCDSDIAPGAPWPIGLWSIQCCCWPRVGRLWGWPRVGHLWKLDNWLPAHRAADGNDVDPYTMGYFTCRPVGRTADAAVTAVPKNGPTDPRVGARVLCS